MCKKVLPVKEVRLFRTFEVGMAFERRREGTRLTSHRAWRRASWNQEAEAAICKGGNELPKVI